MRISRKLAILSILSIALTVLYFSDVLVYIKQYSRSTYILENVDIDCDAIIREDSIALEKYSKWRFDYQKIDWLLAEAEEKSFRCRLIMGLFKFRTVPVSEEEAQFPLAYGIVAYAHPTKFLLQLSAFYHPQNLYVIAIEEDADENFKTILMDTANCLHNVKVLIVPEVTWGEYSVVHAVMATLRDASKERHPWKYWQYLSGVDAPLKTNLEMVRICKAMNNAPNFELGDFTDVIYRLNQKKLEDSPIPIFKSSLSAVLPRATVDAIVNSDQADQYLRFLKDFQIPDEQLWATFCGSPEVFRIPGSISAATLLKAIKEEGARVNSNATTIQASTNTRYDGPHEDFEPESHFIGRYQAWSGGRDDVCKSGEFPKASCAFGVGDVATLLKRPALVAHKFYPDVQPAAFLCILKEIERRTENPSKTFTGAAYSKLPQVEMAEGKPISRPDLLRDYFAK